MARQNMLRLVLASCVVAAACTMHIPAGEGIWHHARERLILLATLGCVAYAVWQVLPRSTVGDPVRRPWFVRLLTTPRWYLAALTFHAVSYMLSTNAADVYLFEQGIPGAPDPKGFRILLDDGLNVAQFGTLLVAAGLVFGPGHPGGVAPVLTLQRRVAPRWIVSVLLAFAVNFLALADTEARFAAHPILATVFPTWPCENAGGAALYAVGAAIAAALSRRKSSEAVLHRIGAVSCALLVTYMVLLWPGAGPR